ncbi:MAG: Jag N-terminal domain-containing protein [Elusimicrobiaceae bacterium]|nr:Jag N-terminal domain-containing protein [Elusimicrobiaceae bacterium]
MPTKIKIQAKEVSDAITKGLRQLGLRRDQVEVSILQHPKKGFLGIGAKMAVVELRPKRWSTADLDAQIYMDVPKRKGKGRGNRKDKLQEKTSRRGGRRKSARLEAREPREKTPKANEPQMLPCEAIRNAVIPQTLQAPMQEAKEYLEKVLTHMGVKTENLNVWWDEKQQRILLTFDCDHPAIVIGKEGKTLEAIQYLCTLALSRHYDKPISVITDTQNYWRKAEDKLDAEIEKGVSLIKNGHSIFRFRPMPAQLRRYIHRAVERNEYVTTASEGEGKWRKVTLRPTEKAAELLNANKAPADFVPGVIGEDVTTDTPAENAAPAAENAVETAPVSCCETTPAPTESSASLPLTEAPETAPAATVEAEKPAQTPAAQTQPLPEADCGPLFAQVSNDTDNK